MAEASLLKPDREFIDHVVESGGENVKHCFQCATCSVVCELSGDRKPFPRKEMIWAQWGLKDRLMADPDIWLCYQCNDCTTHCPRGARPGDVMGAIRREAVIHYGLPGILGRWVNQPQTAPLLFVVAAALLGLALLLKEGLGIEGGLGGRVVYAYTPIFPHWLLNGFFIFFGLLVLLVFVSGVSRFWGAMKAADARNGTFKPVLGVWPSMVAALKKIVTHGDFPQCTTERPRLLSHMLVFFGFLALSLIAFWIVTIRFNPFVPGTFAFPFAFWSPWKLLANLGGAAILAGCLLMAFERLKADKAFGSYFDWAFILLILCVVGSGFFTEVLHYFRVENFRYVVYFFHLTFVFCLLVYLPYSKFAHAVYRTTALIYAEHTGRQNGAEAPAAAPKPVADTKPEETPKPEGESKPEEASKPEPETKPEGNAESKPA
ncbi:MAG: quinone-interacting membrane-bound oxidoreductase complex subunit QmoC [Planctomycetota bacterium]|jgi:quinone-modifying oxidoreductase subunit QmoC